MVPVKPIKKVLMSNKKVIKEEISLINVKTALKENKVAKKMILTKQVYFIKNKKIARVCMKNKANKNTILGSCVIMLRDEKINNAGKVLYRIWS